LGEIITQSWEFIQERTDDITKVHISTNQFHDFTTPRTLIHLLNVDRQFIVNTVKNILTQHKLNIEMIRHPVLHIERNDSGQLVKINEQFDDSQTKGIYESIVCIQIKGKLTPQETKKLHDALFEGLTYV